MTDTLNIYVADLAAYNSGLLHGEWIDLGEHDFDAESVHKVIEKLLKGSPTPNAEEFAIHDSEGFGDAIGEYTSIEEVCEIAEILSEHGDVARASLALGDGLTEARERLDNGYYAVEDLAEYAQEFVESTGLEIPSYIRVDWDATGRELAMDMSQVRYGATLYLFQSC